jgi:autotransporter strand-loop-strand O-heptosyltransferase
MVKLRRRQTRQQSPDRRSAAAALPDAAGGPAAGQEPTGETPPAGSAAVADGAGQDYDAASPATSAAGAAGPATPSPDPFVVPPPALPTQKGPLGIRYDFNDGARVWLPRGKWHVRMEDGESGNIIFACDADEGWVVSTKKYYVPFVIKVWERGKAEPLLDHALDLKDREVLIKFPVGTLGDLVGWFPYAEKFFKKHGCILACALAKNLIDIFQSQYPDLYLTTPQEVWMKEPYASYRVGLFFRGDRDNQPIDFRMVGLHKTAGHILGVDPAEEPPRLDLDVPRALAEPYVCIATKSSCQAKFWNNGHGWNQVVAHLKALGYRVLAVDKDATVGQGFTWNQVPHGVEDRTGKLPLPECIGLLAHAEFFIGLSSGLSWLAWACKIPVVMISGFSLPGCEFHTPYRVYSTHGCLGCWDDITLRFDHHDFFWCPRFKGTERQYECTRLITGQQVIGHIERLRADFALAAPRDASPPDQSDSHAMEAGT